MRTIEAELEWIEKRLDSNDACDLEEYRLNQRKMNLKKKLKKKVIKETLK